MAYSLRREEKFFMRKLNDRLYIALSAFVTSKDINQGPVVQSIVSLTSSLRGQLLKCFSTLKPNTLKFFVEKIREA